MMLKRPAAVLKRPAAAEEAAGASSAKRAKAGNSRVRAVVALLRRADEEEYPTNVIDMLADALPHAIVASNGARHALQHDLLALVSTVVASVEAAAKAKHSEAQAAYAALEAQQSERIAFASSATAAAQEQVEAVQAAKDALAGSITEVAMASAALREAAAAQKAEDASFSSLATQKYKLECLRTGDLEAMRTGSIGAVDCKDKAKQVVQAAREFGADATMATSAEKALCRPAAGRGQFDAMVVQQLDEAFEAAIADLGGRLSREPAWRAEAEQKLAAVNAQMDAASEKKKSAEQVLHDAQEAAKASAAEAKAAEKSVKEIAGEVKTAGGPLTRAAKELSTCSEGLRIFQELAEGRAEGDSADPEATPSGASEE